jgi:hypothetical protein
MTSFNIAHNFKAFSKFVLACPAISRFRAGSLDELAMLLHHRACWYTLGIEP